MNEREAALAFAFAFAKVNLCLFLGQTRADGRHELVTLLEPVGLRDDLAISLLGDGEPDQVLCERVRSPNLVADALAGLRAAGWSAPPVRVEIHKRIPIAAGMGGGSADAAAMLRYAPRLAPVAGAKVAEIAAGLGADVPSQLEPGSGLATGAGEIVEPVHVGRHSLVVVPQHFGLSTADVYREADRLELLRSSREIEALRAELRAELRASAGGDRPAELRASAGGDRPAARLPRHLIVNDLQPASVSLRPELSDTLALVLDAGAEQAIVCGSGPTVIGIFWGCDSFARADGAARRLHARCPAALATDPILRGTLAPTANE